MKLSRTASARTHTCRDEATSIVRGTPRKSGAISEKADLAAWCEALASVVPRSVNAAPPGWKTIFALADEQKTSQTTLRTKLAGLIAAGKCERRKFRVERNGYAHTLYHYRLK